MRCHSGIICMIAGAVLILAALLLLLFNRMEDQQAGQAASAALEKLQLVITEQAAAAESTPDNYVEQHLPDPAQPAKMLEVNVDGYDYIGYLSIPVLEIELPVMADWDYARLEIAACRQFGSTKTDDLVIAAHNYKNHFGRISELLEGDVVTFTEMDGMVDRYSVCEVLVMQPTAVEEVQNSDWDLVLYTCTYGGDSRIVVGCQRIK